jgi:competence protein ComFC
VCESCLAAVRGYDGAECARCGLFLSAVTTLHGSALCGLCRRKAFAFQQARSFGWYDGALREVIHCLKYDGFRPLAGTLAAHLGSAIARLEQKEFDLILPVPLHRKRERRRGFNQSALLAQHLAKRTGLPFGRKDCVRVRDTRPQTGLRAAERRKNVSGAFEVPDEKSVEDRRVLLIDDVLTTGATANACASALVAAGAAGVWVATLARVHRADLDVL